MVRVAFLIALLAFAAGCVGQSAGMERTHYNLSPDVFAALPLLPSDFKQADKAVQELSYGFEKLPQLGEEYYKQPEFLPTWETIGVKNMRSPPEDRVALWGLGAYPAEQRFSAKPGDEFTAATFFHTSWMVQTYQGMHLALIYNETYFDVTIEPDRLVLAPAYPAFERDWSQKVVVKIRVKEGSPIGEHLIRIRIMKPDEADERAWREQYGGRYVNAPDAVPHRAFVRLAVDVT